MKNKALFKNILLLVTIVLMLLPLVMPANDAMTNFVKKIGFETVIMEHIVPYQVQIIKLVASPLVREFIPLKYGMQVNDVYYTLNWNCLGWQSFLIFVASLVIGLRGRHSTLFSKLQVVCLGIFGIYWVNILRIVVILLLGTYAKPFYRYVFHDLLAAVVTIVFLLLFWWFSYKYILEENHANESE